MPVKGRQAVNLRPVKKTPPAQRKEIIPERTSILSERSSLKSTSSGTKQETKTTKIAPKTPPSKKKITQATLDRAKRERERMAQQAQQQQQVSRQGAPAGPGDKKGMEYMKERITHEKPGHQKIIREPKKLEHGWDQQNLPEGELPPPLNLTKEEAIAYYGSLGVDYHSIDFRRPELRPKRAHAVPINRIIVKKITAPKLAKEVATVYETGTFHDLHYPVKHDLSKEKVPEHGVYENQPGTREGVFRETDLRHDEFIEPGTLGALINEWKMKGKQTLLGARKKPIDIDKSNTGPELLENDPTTLEGVVRERDETAGPKPGEGTARNLLEICKTWTDTVSVERAPITLVEDPSAPTVFESEPTVREGVIRNTDKIEDATLEQGGAKGLVGYWKTVTDEVSLEKRPINIREGKEIVLESQPIVREGVVRESDAGEDLTGKMLAEQKAKLSREAYLEAQRLAAEHKGKAVVLDLAQDGGVLENEPSVRTDVVKSDVTLEDFVPGEKHTKKLLSRYMEIAASDYAGGSRGPIEVDRSGGLICENEPAALADGIIRGGISGREVSFEEGKTRSMVDQWRNKGDKEFRRHFEGKPQWILEIEQAQEAGVYENQPITREGVLREQDIYQPVGFSVPTEITKGMKDMWLNREAYEEEKRMRMRETKPELVCFTPPRERSPEPTEEEYQAYQQLLYINDEEFERLYANYTPGPPPMELKTTTTKLVFRS